MNNQQPQTPSSPPNYQTPQELYQQPPQGGQPPYSQPPSPSYQSATGIPSPYGSKPDDGNSAAIAALVCGIIAFLGGWTVIGGIAFGIAALILAHVRSKKYKICYPMTGPSRAKEIVGRVFAILGIVQAALIIALTVFAVGIFIDEGIITTDGNGNYEFNFEYDSDDDSDYQFESTDTTYTPVDATSSSPATIGEWVRYSTESRVDGRYHEVYLRVVSVEYDQDVVQAAIDEFNSDASDFFYIEELDDDDLEYALVNYEVYIPEDFPVYEDYVLAKPTIYFTVYGTDGSTLTVDGVLYTGLIGEDLTTSISVTAGDLVSGTCVIPTVIGADEFLLKTDYRGADDYFRDYILIER